MSAARRVNDFYPTPAWATEILLDRTPISGKILEPCAGDGRISSVIERAGLAVMTNDIDARFDCNLSEDALGPDLWHIATFDSGIDWVVSNPPFTLADRLVPLAYEKAHVGVAMLLRLSWLEPTQARGLFLEEHPPSRLLVLPRISFDGSGKTDNVTCAWFIWNRWQFNGQVIEIVPRRAPQPALQAAP